MMTNIQTNLNTGQCFNTEIILHEIITLNARDFPKNSTYLVCKLVRNKFAHEKKSRVLLLPHQALHHPQVGIPGRGQTPTDTCQMLTTRRNIIFGKVQTIETKYFFLKYFIILECFKILLSSLVSTLFTSDLDFQVF